MRAQAAGFALIAALAAGPAGAASISSEYTQIDGEKGCATVASSAEEGGSATLACAGYRGYPVLIYAGDLRETVYYGFPPGGRPAWESFGPFNGASGRIEWRVRTDGDTKVPFAAIQRFTVSDPQDDARKVEVLVVAKVGQPQEQDGCAVGLVLATGNPNANEMARKIADESAADFACGADERTLVGSPMPDFARNEP